MAGNQVLEWSDLDTEIKTSGLANVGPIVFRPCQSFDEFHRIPWLLLICESIRCVGIGEMTYFVRPTKFG